ncbi:MAG: LysR family transcriptional regulator [Clostridiales bacterium]|nr:LysR family transcriptional regulator [Clostridiales bacterium]
MELTQLLHFKTIAECGQLTLAASQLYITPPALSQSIRKLEEELGADLFIRRRKTMELTSIGEDFLEYVQQVFDILGQARQQITVAKEQQLTTDRLRIGYTAPAALKFLNGVYADFPHTTRLIAENEVQNELNKGSIDLALSLEPASRENITCISLLDERFLIAVPQEHPLAQRESISVRDLHHQTFIRLLCDQGTIRERMEQLEKFYKIKRSIVK